MCVKRYKWLGINAGVAGLVLWAATASAAQWANPQLLLTPEDVMKNIDKPNWVVVDCQDLEDYLKGHIPGAISLGKKCGKALRDPSSRLLEPKKYEELLGKVGIGNNTHVVFYHDDMKDFTDATVGFWVMEYLGHDKVYVLNGGLDAWRKAGQKLDTTPVKKEPTTFKAKVVASRLAPTSEILKIAKGQMKGVQLVDSRTGKEHKGEDIRSVRGGHVPNTTANISHLDTLPEVKDPKTDKMVTTAYLDPDVAAKAFAKLDKNKRTVGYCQTGTRSTLTYLQLRALGFKNPANWDESWRVYGARTDYPAADEQWYNFDAVNKELKSLDKKVETLEASTKK